jgi:hypothetical protein
MKSKVRIRQLLNDKWIVEKRKLFWWIAVRIDTTTTTKAGAEARVFNLPLLVYEPVGGNNYPLAWHDSRSEAVETWKTVKSLAGEEE